MTRLRIAVLMGGPSPERDVSMSTGREIVAALDPLRYDVLPVEITKEGHWLPRPDLKPLTDGNPHAGLAGSGRSAGTRERGAGSRAVARSRGQGRALARRRVG